MIDSCMICGRMLGNDNSVMKLGKVSRSRTDPNYCKTCVGRRRL